MPVSNALELDLISVAAKLPTAPRLLIELGASMRENNCTTSAVVELLKQDSSLVARILRIANSPAYAPGQRINDLEHAFAFVGFAEIHRLVGVVASEQLAEIPLQYYPGDAQRLRRHTLFVAILMEHLGRETALQPRECYTVGLMRSLGMMALERMIYAVGQASPFRQSGLTQLHHWEY